jgi:hypothetical protein
MTHPKARPIRINNKKRLADMKKIALLGANEVVLFFGPLPHRHSPRE